MDALLTITQACPPMDIDELTLGINNFRKLSLVEKYGFIDKLVATHPILNLEWKGGHHFRRARKLNFDEWPKTVEDVIWRKDATAQLGRANPEGFQVLYVADRLDTALREVDVAQIDRVAIAEFVIREGQSIFVCPIGEMLQIARSGRGFLSGDSSGGISNFLNACPIHEARSLLLADAFLYEQMVGQDNYKISSRVAMSIFNKRSEVTAVAYSSRRQRGAINWAIKAEGFWENWGLVSSRRAIAEHLALGFYKLSDVANVTGITNSGEFRWEGESGDNDTKILLHPPYFPVLL